MRGPVAFAQLARVIRKVGTENRRRFNSNDFCEISSMTHLMSDLEKGFLHNHVGARTFRADDEPANQVRITFVLS